MRRFFLILITLSLSPTAMGYACEMSGAVPQLACCCDGGATDSCPQSVPDCSHDAMNGEGDDCCSVVVTLGTSTQGQAQTLTSIDLPGLGPAVGQRVAATPARILAVVSHLSARDHSALPIYLLTGRLRR